MTSPKFAADISYYYRRHSLTVPDGTSAGWRPGLGATGGNKRKDNELRLQSQFIF